MARVDGGHPTGFPRPQSQHDQFFPPSLASVAGGVDRRNLAPMPGVFPDYPALVMRDEDARPRDGHDAKCASAAIGAADHAPASSES
jgi:hypothetical protein